MSDEVTIPRETARRMAAWMRQRNYSAAGEWADLLDPPPLSLRDEVAVVYRDEVIGVSRDSWDEVADHAKVQAYRFADAVLAVVRKHYRERAEGLVFWDSNGNPVMDRRDVLALFGGDDE